jgi:membrane protein YdbS with pleckstrin-like domain
MTDFIKNDKTAFKYEIKVMTVLCIIMLIFPVAIIFLVDIKSAFAVLLYVLCGGAIIAIILFSVISTIIGHKNYCYKIDEKSVQIKKSFIFAKHIYLPKNKIKLIKIENNHNIKVLCNIIFVNDAYDVIIKNISLSVADRLLKENFKGVYFNDIQTKSV